MEQSHDYKSYGQQWKDDFKWSGIKYNCSNVFPSAADWKDQGKAVYHIFIKGPVHIARFISHKQDFLVISTSLSGLSTNNLTPHHITLHHTKQPTSYCITLHYTILCLDSLSLLILSNVPGYRTLIEYITITVF